MRDIAAPLAGRAYLIITRTVQATSASPSNVCYRLCCLAVILSSSDWSLSRFHILGYQEYSSRLVCLAWLADFLPSISRGQFSGCARSQKRILIRKLHGDGCVTSQKMCLSLNLRGQGPGTLNTGQLLCNIYSNRWMQSSMSGGVGPGRWPPYPDCLTAAS